MTGQARICLIGFVVMPAGKCRLLVALMCEQADASPMKKYFGIYDVQDIDTSDQSLVLVFVKHRIQVRREDIIGALTCKEHNLATFMISDTLSTSSPGKVNTRRSLSWFLSHGCC
jgi:hypothetical protein